MKDSITSFDSVKIGNGRIVPKGSIAYRVRGGEDYPELERVTVEYGTQEIAIHFPDSPRSSGSRVQANSIFETPEEAVEYHVAKVRERFDKAIRKAYGLLK